MADYISLARPYAQAAFEFALQEKQISLWAEQLEKLENILRNTTVAKVLDSPRYSGAQRAEIILALARDKSFMAPFANFIKLLAENHRLFLVSGITQLFKEMVTEHEKILQAQVTSALKLDEAFLHNLNQTLNKKLGKTVKLHTQIDPNLLGGLIVRVGDLVLDGSVRGELSRLQQALLN